MKLFIVRALIGLMVLAPGALLGGCEGGAVVSGGRDGATGMDVVNEPSCSPAEALCSGQCVNVMSSREHCGACGAPCGARNVCVMGRCALDCPPDQTACGGQCVAPRTDRAHCGSCNNPCASGLVCTEGRCDRECGAGLAVCGAAGADGGSDAGTERYCADFRSDRANCGACGGVCGAGQICMNGVCALTCIGAQTECMGACRDLTTDNNHCGACGTVCPAGQVCSAGTCRVSCGTGLEACMGSCRDLSTDNNHCGACGTVCAAGQVCSRGVCSLSCATGSLNCSGTCHDLQNDRLHCGACGAPCAAGEVCAMGRCALSCATGLSPCGSTCRDQSTDRLHCGACDNACGSGRACVMSRCVVSCVAGQTECSGTCRDLATDNAHCGACATACVAGQLCSGGACALSCAAGLSVCSGTCRDLATDNAHCGACGQSCPPGQVCAAGACTVTCSMGFSNCSGACQNVLTDRQNCGACGVVCPTGQICAAGACALSCAAGQAVCSGTCRDLTTDNNHCGACGTVCAAGQVCNGGTCAASCGAGLSTCAGACINTAVDPAHCGGCAAACSLANASAFCLGGRCGVAMCAAGFRDCNSAASDGCEVTTASDVSHCGGCNAVCPTRSNALAMCSSGACGFGCDTGFGDCNTTASDGCEIDLRSATAHCGACGRPCSLANATAGCAAGACTVTACSAGFGDCNGAAGDGCETNTQSSAAHCGACGRSCSFANAAATCASGTCALGACNAGFSNCDANAVNGCETAGACVYATCNAVPRSFPSGVYTLSAGGTNWQAYCEMALDGGGWTLVAKVPGRDGTWVYTAALWTNTTTLTPTSTDLSQTPAKFTGFSTVPFTQLRLGMVDGATRFIVLSVSASPLPSILSVFQGASRATSAGRNAWRSLLASPSLQSNCNAEGFNLSQSGNYQAVRLGILGNQEGDCNTPDSRIGFGGQFNLCAAGGDVSCGNVASCSPDNGDRNTATFGYIFVR